MVAFNFQEQFSADVERGNKRQTIRMRRRARAGDQFQLYTAMRTKKCRKLRDAVCTAVDEITIIDRGYYLAVRLNGELLSTKRARDIAIADGFENLAAFADFFSKQYGLPFRGWLIQWV